MSKVLLGLDRFHYAILNSDTTAGATYQTPVPLKGAISIAVNTNSEVATLFADDGPFDTAESIGEIELNVNIADMSQEDYAALMGHTISGGVMEELSSDQPIDVAFGFRAKRSNGGYSYFWLYKGKFSKPAIDHETKADGINWQTPTFNGKFTQRIYDSKYKGSDGVERNTAFNGNYVVNFLMGKEFKVGENAILSLDTKVTYAGGRRYTPIDLEASIAAGEEIRTEDLSYTKQYDPYARWDFKIGYKLNHKKFAQSIALDIRNVTGRENIFLQSYNDRSKEVETTYQTGFFPVVLYSVYF
jgi:phi13 family phage major tail protein